jgi:hypothetical protein
VIDEILEPDRHAGEGPGLLSLARFVGEPGSSGPRLLIVDLSERIQGRLSGVRRGQGGLHPIDCRHGQRS